MSTGLDMQSKTSPFAQWINCNHGDWLLSQNKCDLEEACIHDCVNQNLMLRSSFTHERFLPNSCTKRHLKY